jgi:hypothetical protein
MKRSIPQKMAVLSLALLGFVLSANVTAQSCPFLPGCLDPTFGAGGKVTIQFPISPTGSATGPLDMAIQSDGKILELLYENKIVRLNADGTLDQAFGSAA